MIDFIAGELITAKRLNEVIASKDIKVSTSFYGPMGAGPLTERYNLFLPSRCLIQAAVDSSGTGINRPTGKGWCSVSVNYRQGNEFVNVAGVHSDEGYEELNYTTEYPGEYEIIIDGYGYKNSGYDPGTPNPDGTYPPGWEPPGRYWEESGTGILEYLEIRMNSPANIGDFLICYDDPTISLNRLEGEPLTVKVLNTGRVTTAP